MNLDDIPFIQARNYRAGGNVPVSRIVIHDMEAPETDTTAEATAKMFATTTRDASAHYNVDNNSIVRSVKDEDVAYHAPPNTGSIGIEHAGYASQRLDQWTDEYSTRELRLSAELTRALCDKYGVPKRFVNAEALKAGAHGITTHWEVSKAFHKTDHTDPGPNFPMDLYVGMVTGASTPPEPVPTPTPGGKVESAFPVVGIITHPSWQGGYIIIAADGGTFSEGDAPNYGSMGGKQLGKPVVGGAVTPTGLGYWLVGADGGVYSFGDAQFEGSTGNTPLNAPVVGIEAFSPQGYWLVAEDGGIFAFGDAPFKGSV